MAYQESRQSLLAKIHIAKKDLGLTEDVYRAMVLNITGVESCSKASYKALVALVAEMRAKGWKGNSDSWLNYSATPKFQPGCEKLAGKIRAILLDTDKSWNYAQGIAEKAFGKKLQECSAPDLQKIIGLLLNASKGGGKTAMQKVQAAAKSATLCANTVKNAVLAYYRFQRKFPYVATECWDCDVIASDGERLVEVEVKVSWNDYQREFKKPKHTEGQKVHYPNRMYFAAPVDLAQRIATDSRAVEGGYGVIAVDEKGQTSVLRKAKQQHGILVAREALNDIALRISSELFTLREQVRA